MKTLSLLSLAFLFWVMGANAGLNVVATLPDFGALAQEIGGDRIKVTTLARGSEDAHFVDAKPSFLTVLNKADLLLESGAGLEIGWLPPLVNNARNRKIIGDASGHILLSEGMHLLDLPSGPIDRSMGDVHPHGNPHYWLDPSNGKILVQKLADIFSDRDTANAAFYKANLEQFAGRLDAKIIEWKKLLEPYRGTKVVTYHKSFDYFLHFFGFELVGTLEPKPGLEPSPSYISSLIPRLKHEGVSLILVEPFRGRKTPEYVADAIGARWLVLPEKTGGHEKATDYLSLLNYNVTQVASALGTAK